MQTVGKALVEVEAKALVETLRDGIAKHFQKHFKTL